MTTSPARPSSRVDKQLRRELARARDEKRTERRSPQTPKSPPLSGTDRFDRAAWIRVMLSDPHSRNP